MAKVSLIHIASLWKWQFCRRLSNMFKHEAYISRNYWSQTGLIYDHTHALIDSDIFLNINTTWNHCTLKLNIRTLSLPKYTQLQHFCSRKFLHLMSYCNQINRWKLQVWCFWFSFQNTIPLVSYTISDAIFRCSCSDSSDETPIETQHTECTLISGDVRATAEASVSRKLEGFCATGE